MRVLFLSAFARLPAGIDPGAPAGHSLRKIGNTNCPPAAEPLCRAGRDAFMQMPEPDRRVIAAKADIVAALRAIVPGEGRSEEHTSELQSLMRISYAVFCLKKKKKQQTIIITYTQT